MKFKEINKRFTEVVSDYIGKGYIINTKTMGSSEVDLVKGNDFVRVLLTNKYDYFVFGDIYLLEVRTATKPMISSINTIWDSDLSLVSQEKFCRIGYHGDWYGTEDEAKEARKITASRFYNKDAYTGKVSLRVTPSVVKYVRRQRGYKTCKVSEIEACKRIYGDHVVYQIYAKGNPFSLK